MWKNGYESFEEFLHDAKLSEATASKLINIYTKFHLEWKLTPERLVEAGGWTVVATLLPICKTRAEAEEWMDKAQLLSRVDLEKEIKEFRTGKPMATCLHDNSYLIRVCRTCGDRIRIYEEE